MVPARRFTLSLWVLAVLPLVATTACGGGEAEPTPTPTAEATSTAEAAGDVLEPTITSQGVTALYSNPVFQVELQYPSGWVADFDYAADIGRDGIAEMFRDPRGREQGFFQVNALSGDGFTLDEAASAEVSHKLKPYGLFPRIETIAVGGREARLILADDTAPEPFLSELVVPYPAPVVIDQPGGYNFLIIYAHKDFVRSLAGTLRLLQ